MQRRPGCGTGTWATPLSLSINPTAPFKMPASTKDRYGLPLVSSERAWIPLYCSFPRVSQKQYYQIKSTQSHPHVVIIPLHSHLYQKADLFLPSASQPSEETALCFCFFWICSQWVIMSCRGQSNESPVSLHVLSSLLHNAPWNHALLAQKNPNIVFRATNATKSRSKMAEGIKAGMYLFIFIISPIVRQLQNLQHLCWQPHQVLNFSL